VFALAKGATLVAAWLVLAIYARTNLSFVRQACAVGSAAYVFVWTTWFVLKA